MDKTTKRLLTASRLGVTFDYGDGHRWLWFHDECTNEFPLIERLENNNIIPKSKMYGNIIDVLDYVDELLKLINEKSLEEQFDDYNDWECCV